MLSPASPPTHPLIAPRSVPLVSAASRCCASVTFGCSTGSAFFHSSMNDAVVRHRLVALPLRFVQLAQSLVHARGGNLRPTCRRSEHFVLEIPLVYGDRRVWAVPPRSNARASSGASHTWQPILSAARSSDCAVRVLRSPAERDAASHLRRLKCYPAIDGDVAPPRVPLRHHGARSIGLVRPSHTRAP